MPDRLRIECFAGERLALNSPTIERVLTELTDATRAWGEWIARSFLPAEQKGLYATVVGRRLGVLGLPAMTERFAD